MTNEGETAPDFMLDDHEDSPVKLSDYRGKWVLLSFHPLAWTGVCAKQMKSLDDNHSRFEELNAVPFGINVDSVPCKKAWAKDLGLKRLRMLSDFWPHGDLARQLAIFREADGFSERANVLVAPDGKVAFQKVYPISELPDIEEIIELIKQHEVA